MPETPGEADDAAPEIVSQRDIDALLENATSNPALRIFSSRGEPLAGKSESSISPYDFRNPMFLTEVELRQIRQRNEQFVYYLAARISMLLRMECELELCELQTIAYRDFTDAIPTPTYLSLFRIDDDAFSGVGIVNLVPGVAMTVVDRLLGGKGASGEDVRYLTEIEMTLMDDVLSIVLEEWCRQWSDLQELSASQVGRETNGRFLQTAAHDAIMLVLSIKATIGDCKDIIQIGLPYHTIEPLVKQLREINQQLNESGESDQDMKWRVAYDDITVSVVADWDAFETPVSDVLCLRAGDIIEMPKEILSKTRIHLEDSLRFYGEVGVEEGRVAVKITEKVEANVDTP